MLRRVAFYLARSDLGDHTGRTDHMGGALLASGALVSRTQSLWRLYLLRGQNKLPRHLC